MKLWFRSDHKFWTIYGIYEADVGINNFCMADCMKSKSDWKKIIVKFTQ